MESIVLHRQKELSFDVNKCIICQKNGSLVCTENGRIRIIEAAQIRNDEVYERLSSTSLDTDFKYHMDNKCYKNYVHKKTLERIQVIFLSLCSNNRFSVSSKVL